jgi:hypothetical protein
LPLSFPLTVVSRTVSLAFSVEMAPPLLVMSVPESLPVSVELVTRREPGATTRTPPPSTESLSTILTFVSVTAAAA